MFCFYELVSKVCIQICIYMVSLTGWYMVCLSSRADLEREKIITKCGVFYIYIAIDRHCSVGIML